MLLPQLSLSLSNILHVCSRSSQGSSQQMTLSSMPSRASQGLGGELQRVKGSHLEACLIFSLYFNHESFRRSAKESNLYCEIAEGINSYAVGKHRHMPEIEQVRERLGCREWEEKGRGRERTKESCHSR